MASQRVAGGALPRLSHALERTEAYLRAGSGAPRTALGRVPMEIGDLLMGLAVIMIVIGLIWGYSGDEE